LQEQPDNVEIATDARRNGLARVELDRVVATYGQRKRQTEPALDCRSSFSAPSIVVLPPP
jgi:hypothetical protein